jgi:hypothetical protein
MKPRDLFLAISLSALLAACGGADGGGIASAPSPLPTPTPPPTITSTSVVVAPLASPATRQGTFDTIALVESYGSGDPSQVRTASPGEVRIQTYQPVPGTNDFSYALELPANLLPSGMSELSAIFKAVSADVQPNGSSAVYTDDTIGAHVLRFGDQLTATNSYSDGSTKLISSFGNMPGYVADLIETSPSSGIILEARYETGLSHVAMGSWAWTPVGILPDGSTVQESGGGSILFVHGDRTQAGAIPVSGTATYSASSLVSFASSSIPGGVVQGLQFSLTTDFAQRLISTLITQDYATFPLDEMSTGTVPGLNVSGTTTFNPTGEFSIPLSGSLTVTRNELPLPLAVTGSLDGAFFGPGAEQIGGVFWVGQVPGNALLKDVFVGVRD